MTKRLSVLIAAIAAALLPAAVALATPLVTARLGASEVAVGESTSLTITVEADDVGNARPTAPVSNGASITPLGTSQQISIINGSVSRATRYTYRVVPTRMGKVSIGPVSVGGGRSAPVTLNVVAADVASRRTPSRQNAPSTASSPTVLEEPAGRRAFLRVNVPKTDLVVGESVPITVRAYVKAGTAGTITGAPELSVDAFAIHDLVSDPKQGRAEIAGTPYATLTWRGKMTAVVPGEHDVKVALPATLEWRDIMQTERADPFPTDRFGSIFDQLLNDPAWAGGAGGMPASFRALFSSGGFGSRFTTGFGASHSANVELEDGIGTVRVSEPPVEGRPDGYDGAIGRFEVHAEIAPTETRVGEPVTLTLRVRGEGSFDRVHHLLLPDDTDGFRVYPVSSELREADTRGGIEAEKVFSQSLVPTHDGTLAIEPLALTYYDPERAEYATITTEPLSLVVQPSLDGASLSHDLTDASRGTDEGVSTPVIASSPGAFVSSLDPIPKSPWPFAAVLLGMGLAAFGVVGVRRRDRDAARKRALARRQRRAYREAAKAMRAATKEGDAPAFFRAARTAIQRRYGAELGIAPETVTLAELESRLPRLPIIVATALDYADAESFAGRALDTANLHDWLAQLTHTLEEEIDA